MRSSTHRIRTVGKPTRHPVNRCRNLLLIPRLQRIHHPQHLRRIPPRTGRIAHDQPNRLLRINHKHTPDRKSNPLLVHIRRVLMIQHIIQIRDLPLLVANDREPEIGPADLVDVLDPSRMGVDGVGGQADQLDAAFGELRLEFGEGAELGGADGGVVLRVGEEDDPGGVDELVEVDGAGGGVGLEVGRDGAEAEAVGIDQYASIAYSKQGGRALTVRGVLL